ncbi:MAG TPA: hypothetical protein VL381_08665 [Rhodocyclaceae bacterium]|jgi:hypothetical protein|nr:hypothetical protein [Rhodocyclaceae bacterium]
MLSSIQEYSILLITACIFMLATVNIFLVWRLIKGTQQETIQLNGIAGQCEQIIVEQSTVKELVSQQQDGLDTTTLEQLDAALSSNYDDLSQATAGFSDLVFELQSVGPEDLAEWKAANEKRITELLGNRDTLRSQVSNLQDMLSKANATILNLRAKTWNGSDAGKSGSDNKVGEELQQARRNSARLSGELSAANENLKSLTNVLAARDKKLNEATLFQQHEKQKMEAEIVLLKQKVQEMQETYDRTILEKSFIEEAFLESESRTKPA